MIRRIPDRALRANGHEPWRRPSASPPRTMPRRSWRSTPRSAATPPSRSRREPPTARRDAAANRQDADVATPGSSATKHGLILGYAYASPHRERAAYRWSVDVSVYVREGRRRGGTGPGPLYVALRHPAAPGLLQRRSPASPCPTRAAIGLHQAMGFQPVGVYRNIGYQVRGLARRRLVAARAARTPARDPSHPSNWLRFAAPPEWDDAIAAGTALLESSYREGEAPSSQPRR